MFEYIYAGIFYRNANVFYRNANAMAYRRKLQLVLLSYLDAKVISSYLSLQVAFALLAS